MAEQILHQYLLSQTAISEYLPRSKLAKVTQLPGSVLDELYDNLVESDDITQKTVEDDIERFASHLHSLSQTAIDDAALQQKQRDAIDPDTLLLGNSETTASTTINEEALENFRRSVAREINKRTLKLQDHNLKITGDIESIATNLSKTQVEVAYDFSSTLRLSNKKLEALEKRVLQAQNKS